MCTTNYSTTIYIRTIRVNASEYICAHELLMFGLLGFCCCWGNASWFGWWTILPVNEAMRTTCTNCARTTAQLIWILLCVCDVFVRFCTKVCAVMLCRRWCWMCPRWVRCDPSVGPVDGFVRWMNYAVVHAYVHNCISGFGMDAILAFRTSCCVWTVFDVVLRYISYKKVDK